MLEEVTPHRAITGYLRENMSLPITEFDPTQFTLTIRFDQGYRFLDKCGEAVIKLENTLDPGWIPGELKPTGGNLRNYTLGLGTTFDTHSLSVGGCPFDC